MNQWGTLVLVALASAGLIRGTTHCVSSPSSDPGCAIEQASEVCARLCATKLQLECGLDGCGCYDCEGSTDQIPWCGDLVETQLECLALQPLASFVCKDGRAVHKGGVCGDESSAVLSCWCEGKGAAVPDATLACDVLCGRTVGLPCHPEQCADQCRARLLDATPQVAAARSAWTAWTLCAAAQPVSSYRCIGDGVAVDGCGDLGRVILACGVAGTP